jgi:protoheme IX farnesyltransferase
LLIAGITLLGWGTTPVAASIATATWCIYVLVYTPLKRRTSWNTFVGAIPGAMPVWIGWTAMDQALDPRAVAVFAAVFFWQFPHFMAIAWRYRDDYARAGMRMLTVVDPTGRRAGIQAICGALALLPVSIIPAWLAPSSVVIATWMLVFSCLFLALAIRFGRKPDDQSARWLLRGSLWYLPALMFAYSLIPWLR